jgi:hypothetical protein
LRTAYQLESIYFPIPMKEEIAPASMKACTLR